MRPALDSAAAVHRVRLSGRLLVAVTRLASHLPLTLLQSLGAGLGWLLDVTNSKRCRVAEINIAACFPQLSPGEQRALRRQALMQSGRFFGELPAAWFRPRSYWAKRLDTSAFDSLAKRLLARGNGLIIALPHLGNWELGVNGFGAVEGFTALYRPMRASAWQSLLRIGRERDDVSVVLATRGGLRTICRRLRDGRAVVILPDQSPAKDQAGAVHAPFFGLPAWTMTLLPQLARRTGAPVLFGYFERQAAGRFAIRCFEAGPAIVSEDALESVTAMNQDVERCVMQCPDQYQWTYRRFKRAPEGVTSIYWTAGLRGRGGRSS